MTLLRLGNVYIEGKQKPVQWKVFTLQKIKGVPKWREKVLGYYPSLSVCLSHAVEWRLTSVEAEKVSEVLEELKSLRDEIRALDDSRQ